jgi:hypothetical protein
MTIGRIPSVEGGIQPTIVDAKGDLIAATAADTVNRLAVGSNDQVLVADSSTSTGLAWKSVATPFAAGKNKIINGDFRINQRSFTSNTTDSSYNFDRWVQFNGGTSGTLTVTPQTFTAGAAPVAGYEAINFVRNVTASGASVDTYAIQSQKVEDVRTFAGQTVTLSFWAKAASGTPSIGIELAQAFGSGGSAQVNTAGGAIAITTSWARYSTTITLPSISGKTIGTGSSLNVNFWLSAGSNSATRASSIGLQNNTFDLWGVQLEAGNVATAFQTATGTLQGELSACQRYYWRSNTGQAYSSHGSFGVADTTTTTRGMVRFPVTMRSRPSAADFSNIACYDPIGNAFYAVSAISMDATATSADGAYLYLTMATATVNRVYFILANNNTAGYIGFSAEL